MADKKLMIDSTIVIDYFRKTDKGNPKLVTHFRSYEHLFISSITEFEVVNGATGQHLQFWDGMLARLIVLDFDSRAARCAFVTLLSSSSGGVWQVNFIKDEVAALIIPTKQTIQIQALLRNEG